jgi:hypothetical protein
MTKLQSSTSGSDRCESYNGCSTDYQSVTYGEIRNTDPVSESPQTASDSVRQLPSLASVSRRRKHHSYAFAYQFWARVDRSGSCWLWTGPTQKRPTQAYGYLWDAEQKKTVHAHRVAWELTHGPIPAGLKVLHRCDRAACVNPACLFLGTQLDNIRDMDRKGRRSPLAHARKGVKFSAAHRAAMSAAQKRRHARTAKKGVAA